MEDVGNRHHEQADNSLRLPQGTKIIHFKFLISEMYAE